jgi:hypothetical protein
MHSLAEPAPPSLLHEQLRQSLAPACDALASAPAALYRVVYVGPLRTPDVLRSALEEAASARGAAFAEWPAERLERAKPVLVLCPWTHAVEAGVWSAAGDAVQLVVWGEHAVEELPPAVHALATSPDALILDPRQAGGPRGEGAAIGGAVQRLATDPRGRVNPLVVVTRENRLAELRDLAQMHLEALGYTVASSAGAHVQPRAGEGMVVKAERGADAAALAMLAARCRSEGTPLVLVAAPPAWDEIRGEGAWRERVGECGLVRGGDIPADSALASVEWPAIPAVWLGASGVTGEVDAMILPRGTTLLEGLRHVEVRGCAARLVAWAADRVAVMYVDHPPAGAAVVGLHVVGRSPASDRAAVLAQLDDVRGWAEAQLAVLPWSPPDSASRERVEEPVQRIGFYFARLDDERGGRPRPQDTAPCLGVHAAAQALLALGLPAAARGLLREAERASRWGVEDEVLLGFLVAERDPEEAITRLRHAALRLSIESDPGDTWLLQTDATLNGLLLMVRTGTAAAAEAWVIVEGWLRRGGADWVSSPRHAAVLFEIAARAGDAAYARHFARRFRGLADPADALARSLDPVFQSVFGGEP